MTPLTMNHEAIDAATVRVADTPFRAIDCVPEADPRFAGPSFPAPTPPERHFGDFDRQRRQMRHVRAMLDGLTAALTGGRTRGKSYEDGHRALREDWLSFVAEHVPGVDADLTWRLQQRDLASDPAPSLYLGLAGGYALRLDWRDLVWEQLPDEHCRTCGELVLYGTPRPDELGMEGPIVSVPACSGECMVRRVSEAQRDQIGATLNAVSDAERRAMLQVIRDQCARAAAGAGNGDSRTPEQIVNGLLRVHGAEDNLYTYAAVLRHRGINLRETKRRQQVYGERVGVFALADGSEFYQVGTAPWTWAPGPRADAVLREDDEDVDAAPALEAVA